MISSISLELNASFKLLYLLNVVQIKSLNHAPKTIDQYLSPYRLNESC